MDTNTIELALASPATENTNLSPLTAGMPVHELSTGPKAGAVDETLYNTEELATWLRISPATIEKDRSLGRGSYPVFVKIGGRRVLYRHADIIQWLHDSRYNHDSSRAAAVL